MLSFIAQLTARLKSEKNQGIGKSERERRIEILIYRNRRKVDKMKESTDGENVIMRGRQ